MKVEEDIYLDMVRILHIDNTLHKRWKRMFGGEGARDERFAPFNSETDWCVVEWAVKSEVGHKQLDHLLAIPGV